MDAPQHGLLWTTAVRYPVVEKVTNISTEKVIPVVDKVFSTFGFPTMLKTDNGSPFQSNLWKEFMNSCGIKHRKITPLWPQANSQAENFNKPMMKAIRSAHIQRQSWKQALYQFCRVYRATPHCSTLFSPHFLMFGHEPRTKLPSLQIPTHPSDNEVRENDRKAKERMKMYADRKSHAKTNEISNGDQVLVKQERQNKLSTNFNPTPLTVINKKGTMITAQRPDGSSITRNSSHFHTIPRQDAPYRQDPTDNTNAETLCNQHQRQDSSPAPDNTNVLNQRPRREIKKPQKYKNFVSY